MHKQDQITKFNQTVRIHNEKLPYLNKQSSRFL